MEIRENTEQNNETVHSMIRQHNAKFMTEFRDYSYHIEENGELAAGIVAEAVFDTVEVEFLCVKETCRGKGYGRRLLKACEEWAKQAGCCEFASDCESANASSRLFHLHTGFQEANRIICFVKKL